MWEPNNDHSIWNESYYNLDLSFCLSVYYLLHRLWTDRYQTQQELSNLEPYDMGFHDMLYNLDSNFKRGIWATYLPIKNNLRGAYFPECTVMFKLLIWKETYPNSFNGAASYFHFLSVSILEFIAFIKKIFQIFRVFKSTKPNQSLGYSVRNKGVRYSCGFIVAKICANINGS